MAVCFTPLFFEDPGDASLDPKKEAYQVQQKINEKFVEAVQFVSFVIEADDGDMIDKESLEDLLDRQKEIIELEKLTLQEMFLRMQETAVKVQLME